MPEEEELDEKKLNINTHDTEEGEIAINMLSVIMEELRGSFFDYVNEANKLILPLINFSTNDSIRKSAAKCLPSMVACVKERNAQAAADLTKMFLTTISQAIHTEFSTDIIQDQIQALRECLEEMGAFLSV